MELILWRHAEAAAGAPDVSRELTENGQAQASRIAGWIKPRLPEPLEILVSPARRAQQTAEKLGLPFVIDERVGAGVSAAGILAAVQWPRREAAVLVVGHQPTLGQVAALLLAGAEADWPITTGALWWFGARDGGKPALRAVISPEFF